MWSMSYSHTTSSDSFFSCPSVRIVSEICRNCVRSFGKQKICPKTLVSDWPNFWTKIDSNILKSIFRTNERTTPRPFENSNHIFKEEIEKTWSRGKLNVTWREENQIQILIMKLNQLKLEKCKMFHDTLRSHCYTKSCSVFEKIVLIRWYFQRQGWAN